MITVFTIVVAIVLVVLYYGLSRWDDRMPRLDGVYGECTVSYAIRVQFKFACPNPASVPAALNEFVTKNPNQKLSSISISFE